MWTVRSEELEHGRGLRLAVERESGPATYADVLRAWQLEGSFRGWFNRLLAESPYSAFRWETPPVTAATLDQPFELVLLDFPGLARRPDPQAFAEHFRGASAAGIVVFGNLGGDALLVVPCPIAAPAAYGHLAAFVREGPEAQQQALWRSVGETMVQRIGARPVWLSTAGDGVAWLHVRLDDRPKYYGFGPYRERA